MQPEVIALLYPDPALPAEGPNAHVTAVLLDDTGLMQVRRMRLEMAKLYQARVAGRLNCGKPIVDPLTREVIGCELDPLAVAVG